MKNSLYKKAVVVGMIVLFIGASVVSSNTTFRTDENTQRLVNQNVVVTSNDWWNTSWSYRKQITINHTKVDDDFVNFPVLICLTDDDLAGKAQNNGSDVMFTDYSGNKLNHEIELFNGSTGEMVAWVNVTSLSSSTDTEIYLYYGNSSCSSQENVTGTWNSDYLGVWHMEDENGTVYDSTSNNINGVISYGGPEDNLICNESGKIGYSLDLWNWYETGSSGAYVDLNDVDTTLSNDTYSVLAWARTRNLGESNYSYYKAIVYFTAINNWEYERFKIIQWRDGGAGNPYNDLYIKSDSYYGLRLGTFNNNWWSDKNNSWRFFYTTHNYSAQLARCYFNTTHYWENTSLLQNVSDIDYLRFGAHVGNTQAYNFNGSIDEIRIEKVDRSWEWINTTYNTMNSPSTFYSVGGEETEPTPPKIPILDLQNIKGGLLGISVALVNSGEATAYDIKWEMNLSEIFGFLFFPKHANGEITQLEPGDEAIIDIGLMFGLGESTVTFYCEYTMILNDSRSELDIGVKQEWRDNGYLIFHTFPEGKQPTKEWRTLKEHEYEYTYFNDVKVVNFTLGPPEPLQLHNVRVHVKYSPDIMFLGACKLIAGEGQLKENWITKNMVESGDAYWQVELVNGE